MPILVPQGGNDVALQGGRQAAPSVDTYAGVAYSGPTDSGLNDLAHSLSSLGGKFNQLADQSAAKKEARDNKNVAYYANVVGALKDGKPYEEQVGALLPELSPTTVAGVLEYKGRQQAMTDAQSAQEEFNANLSLYGDRGASEAYIAQKKAKAIEFAKSHANPSFGAGYLESYEKHLDGLFEGSVNYRTKELDKISREELNGKGIEAAQAALKSKQANVTWDLPNSKDIPNLISAAKLGGKPSQSIAAIKAPFASKVEAMLQDMPPELRKQFSIVSGFRTKEEQERIYEKNGRNNHVAAPPGHSNHEFGEAIDAGAGGSHKNFGSSEVGKWVHANSEKYGLYFPMAHEPWHMEMRGGRRESGQRGNDTMQQYRPAPKKSEVPNADSDGNPDDAGSPVSSLTEKIINQSGLEGSGQNPNSTANGIGQFTNQSWLEAVKTHSPETANGKSDDQILAMKGDPKYAGLAGNLVEKTLTAKSKTLEKSGVDVTESNLYIMHMMPGVGPKLIKAADQTPMTNFVDKATLKANKLDEGTTVGEYKSWVDKRVGGPVTPRQEGQNALRSLDREWGMSRGLAGNVRRDSMAAAFVKHVEQTGDASILKTFPDEWKTPQIKDEFTKAETTAATARLAMLSQARTLQKQQLEDFHTAQMDAFGTQIANGQNVDIDALSRKPDGTMDYELNKKLHEAFNAELSIDPAQSGSNKFNLQHAMETAAITGDYSILGFDKGTRPTVEQITKAIRFRTDLKQKDREDLMKEVPKTMAGNTAMENPAWDKDYDAFVKSDIDTYFKSMDGIMNQKFAELNLYGKTKEAYQSSVEAQVRAHIAKGESWEPYKYDMMKEARKEALALKDRLVASGGDGGTTATTAPASAPAPAPKAEAQAAPKVVDQHVELPPQYKDKPVKTVAGGVLVETGKDAKGGPVYDFVAAKPAEAKTEAKAEPAAAVDTAAKDAGVTPEELKATAAVVAPDVVPTTPDPNGTAVPEGPVTGGGFGGESEVPAFMDPEADAAKDMGFHNGAKLEEENGRPVTVPMPPEIKQGEVQRVIESQNIKEGRSHETGLLHDIASMPIWKEMFNERNHEAQQAVEAVAWFLERDATWKRMKANEKTAADTWDIKQYEDAFAKKIAAELNTGN